MIIGKAIAKYNIPRHELVILTKCFAYVGRETWMPTWNEVSCPFTA